jgi:hypothetical protein
MKGLVTIAYWDTEQSARPPSLIGQIKGTPTIKFYKPMATKGKRGVKKKIVLDYNGAREAKPMRAYAIDQMPGFVERISGIDGKRGLAAFRAKAAKYNLPSAIALSKRSGTPMLKHASTALRRRLLIGEASMGKTNEAVAAELGLDKAPGLVVFAADGETKTVYSNSKFSLRRVEAFLEKHALSAPVGKKKKKKEEESKEEL